MRAALLILLVLGVLAAAWLFLPSATAPIDLAETDPATQTRTREEGADRLGGEAKRESVAPAPAPGATDQPDVHRGSVSLDSAGVPDMSYRITRGGMEVVQGIAAPGYVTLDLPVGTYKLTVKADGFVAPDPSEFVVSEENDPMRIDLAFRPIEARLRVAVLDQATHELVETYRAKVELLEDGKQTITQLIPDPESNPLEILGTRSQRAVVTIEAEGYTPPPPFTVELREATNTIDRKLFLAKAMQFSGVTLRVRDRDGEAQRHLVVEMEARQADGSWKRLWTRRQHLPKPAPPAPADDPDFHLPDLAPGEYRFTARALDAQGRPAMLLPGTEQLRLTGNEHIARDITLEPGASIMLLVQDQSGKPAGKDVSVELVGPDGKRVETVWRTTKEQQYDEKGQLSADVLVDDGFAHLEHCVRPGDYTLRLRRGKAAPVEQSVRLIPKVRRFVMTVPR